eukprot:scaffold34610_cov50-Attheya_sp.AAC.5
MGNSSRMMRGPWTKGVTSVADDARDVMVRPKHCDGATKPLTLVVVAVATKESRTDVNFMMKK